MISRPFTSTKITKTLKSYTEFSLSSRNSVILLEQALDDSG